MSATAEAAESSGVRRRSKSEGVEIEGSLTMDVAGGGTGTWRKKKKRRWGSIKKIIPGKSEGTSTSSDHSISSPTQLQMEPWLERDVEAEKQQWKEADVKELLDAEPKRKTYTEISEAETKEQLQRIKSGD